MTSNVELARRVEELDDDVSETRKAVIGVEKTLERVLGKLEIMEGRWSVALKLFLAAVTGIFGMVGIELFRLISR